MSTVTQDEIMNAMSKIQAKNRLTKTELIAEMALAINKTLVMIEPGLQAMTHYMNETTECA